MKRAAQAAVLHPAVGELGETVRAPQPQQTHAPVRVPKHDQILAQETHLFGLAAVPEIPGKAGCDPVPPKPLTRWGIGTDLANQLIPLCGQHQFTPYPVSRGSRFTRWFAIFG